MQCALAARRLQSKVGRTRACFLPGFFCHVVFFFFHFCAAPAENGKVEMDKGGDAKDKEDKPSAPPADLGTVVVRFPSTGVEQVRS